MKIPSDYAAGYEKAKAIDPDMASNYVAHASIGDPEADAAVEELASIDPEESARYIRAALDGSDDDSLKELPPALATLIAGMETPPDWVDQSAFTPGIRMFHRNSRLVLGAFVGGVLVEGFSTSISKSFFITGRLRDQGVRRLKQNNRHMIELFIPAGLERGGDGWKLSVRVRLVHAQVRLLLKQSDEWDTDAWGVPMHSANMAFAATAFSARLLKHLESLGAVFDDEERASFMAVWRYSGYLMGIPESILFQGEEDALRLFEIGKMCEPPPDVESIVMANSLIQSAPLVIGIEDSSARQNLVKYVYSVSRALIGNELADELNYPKSTTFGVLAWFRLQERYHSILDRIFRGRAQGSNFSRFTSLLEASMFDEAGVSYRLPDHLYAERSGRW